MPHLTLDQINPLIFGGNAITGWAWGGADESVSLAALDAAFAAGIDCIDTAPLYGMGYGEELVGAFLQKVDRSRVYVATKFGVRWDGHEGPVHMRTHDRDGVMRTFIKDASYETIMRECEASLARLHTDYIDLYQFHHPYPEVDLAAAARALRELKNKSRIRAIGVTNFSLEQVKALHAHIEVDSVQCRYSPLNQDIVDNGMLDWAVEHQCTVLAYLILERGLLAGRIDMQTTFPEGDHRNYMPLFKPDRRRIVLEALERVQAHAEALHCSLPSLILQWTLQQKGIGGILVGIRTPAQAVENQRALTVVIPAAVQRELDEIFAACRQRLTPDPGIA